MIITKFGDSYSSAYELPLLKGKQVTNKVTTVISSIVSGADGAYDHFGTQRFPLAPKTITIDCELQGTDYGDVDDELDELILNTMAVGQSRLWIESRNTGTDVPIRYAVAKCISVGPLTEEAGKNFTSIPIRLTFWLPEGVWYSQYEYISAISTIGNPLLRNYGNYAETPVNFYFDPTSQPIVQIRVSKQTGDLITPGNNWVWTVDGPVWEWFDEFDNGVLAGEEIDVNSKLMDVTIDDVDAYADSNGNSRVIKNQVAWIYVDATDDAGVVLDGGNYFRFELVSGGNISAIANTTPIQVTTEENHGLATNDSVIIDDSGLGIDGSYLVTVTGAKTFTLNGSSASGAGTVGRWYFGGIVSSIVMGGSAMTVTTPYAHGLNNGDKVIIRGIDGTGDGVWQVKNVTATTFELWTYHTAVDYGALYSALSATTVYWYPEVAISGDFYWNHTYM